MLRRFVTLQDIPKETLIEFVKEYATLDRNWRKVTEENVELRGKDYDTKSAVEQSYQKSIGYESGFNQLKNI